MKSIFENAKFGDIYITRDEKHRAVYLDTHTFDSMYYKGTLIDIYIKNVPGAFRCLPNGRIFSCNGYIVSDDEYTNLDVDSRAPIDDNDVYKWLR